MDLIEWDDSKWIIETDGTNKTDWAEIIYEADKTYRTLRKVMVSLDWWIWLIELMDPLELVEGKEEHIAKGTTDPRVEFISQILTQIFI